MSAMRAVIHEVASDPEVEGLAEAEAALEAAETKRDGLSDALDRARAGLQAAELDRARLIARAAKGELIAGRDMAKAAQAITDRGAEVSILAEALAVAEGDARRADRAVGTIRGAEKRRRAEHARQVFRIAEEKAAQSADERDQCWQVWQQLLRT